MTVKEFYDKVGGGYEEIIAKFPADVIIIKFLKIFANDGSFAQLKERLAADDADGAFSAAHTLKGVLLNLSLNGLAEHAVKVTEALRAKDIASAKQLFPALEEIYNTAMAALKELL